MKVTLFEDNRIASFFPFAVTRHISELRWGALTIQEKWKLKVNEVYLFSERPCIGEVGLDNSNSVYVNGRCCPTKVFVNAVQALKPGQGLKKDDDNLAYLGHHSNLNSIEWITWEGENVMLDKRTDLFTAIDEQILLDIELSNLHLNKEIHHSNTVIGDANLLHVSPSAKIYGAIINVNDGPVWIDEGAEVMEGSLIRGPFYLGKSSVVKMGAKIYGPTAIGPHCKVGGELGNVSFQGYSNKAHDGFLGNSVIGQWCNLGADTNCSNLKNNYSVVKQYDYNTQKEESTGLNFCGLMMGDYSKCGINTMWNTGSVVGVCVNFYGAGFPKKHLPDFYWGDANAGELYDLKKALETIAIVKSRRGIEVTENERQILTALHAMSIA
jgi:UDP-N-acetylglucosamine diphosphorylase/glucosamine-1-phosphate N-acetyltransferase